MKNVSDLIEEFLLQQLLLDSEINISRNELASFFNCAPSQINYVLSTRFTPLRGFDIESRRGGGGFIKVNKIVFNNETKYLQYLLKNVVNKEIDFAHATQVLENLLEQKFLTHEQAQVLLKTMSDKALANPMKAENHIRANMLKNLILSFMKEE